MKKTEGYLPPKALSLEAEWAMMHHKELMVNRDKMLAKQPFQPIAPLELGIGKFRQMTCYSPIHRQGD